MEKLEWRWLPDGEKNLEDICYGYRFRDDLWVCKGNNDYNNSIAGRRRAIGDGSQHLIDRPSRGGRAHIPGRPGSADGRNV